MIYDVVIVGAGVIGGFIARELSKYKLDICLLEKQSDVGTITSSANSGIVHAGYDNEPGSRKAGMNLRGNQLMEQVARELNVPFSRKGSLVLMFNEEDEEAVEKLYCKGIRNGVPDMRIINKDEVVTMELNISHDIKGALFAPTAGVVCPYELTIGAIENAIDNGVELKLEHEVLDIRRSDPGFFRLITSSGSIYAKVIVNAAGLYADKISNMIGDDSFSIKPRKGEYILLDKNQGGKVNRIIFQPPSELGKGIVVIPSIDGNLLIGPNALDVSDKEDFSTSGTGLAQVISGALKSVPEIDLKQVVTSFAGLRAVPSTGDFIIGESKTAEGFYNAAGIESPGLTSAPAIGEYVAACIAEHFRKHLHRSIEKNKDFNPYRREIIRFREMNNEDRAALIRKNPEYGTILCRCENVSKGEIIDCIRRTCGARHLDGVKRRTRAGMGRCQGGFCAPRVVEVLSGELGIPIEQVTKMGGKSWLLSGKTKQKSKK